MLLKTPRSRNTIGDKQLKEPQQKIAKLTPNAKDQKFSFLNKPILGQDHEQPFKFDISSKKEKSKANLPISNSSLYKIKHHSLYCSDYPVFQHPQYSQSARKDNMKNLPYQSRTLRAFNITQYDSNRKVDVFSPIINKVRDDIHQNHVNDMYYGVNRIDPFPEDKKVEEQIKSQSEIVKYKQQIIESDYIHNIHKAVSHQHTNSWSRKGQKRPIIKVEMDLENNSLLLIQSLPKKRTQKRNQVDRSILKRSLSQSAKVLASKANQLKEEPIYFSPKPEKKKLSAALKFLDEASKSKIVDQSMSKFQNSSKTLENPIDISNLNNNNSEFKKILVGKVNKLSGKGWSYHFRLLKMDQYSLSYYRNVPKDFDQQTLKCPSAESRSIKPKACLPIKKIISVSDIQEDDKKKFKKLDKAHDISFKITFSKKDLLKKEYVPGEDDKNDESDEDQDMDEFIDLNGRTTMQQMANNKSVKSKSKARTANKKVQNLSTWYFVCESRSEQIGWIKQLTISAKNLNPKFKPDETLINDLQNGKQIDQSTKFNIDNNDQDDDDDESYEEEKVVNKQKLQNKGKKETPERSPLKKKNGQDAKQTNQVQQIQLFGNQKQSSNQFENQRDQRADSEYADLNLVLQQNLNINNVNLDADGQINDANANQAQEEDLQDNIFENNQDQKAKLEKLKNDIITYSKDTQKIWEKKNKKEQKGWDLKFQNQWGYLVSADKNLKDNMTLSERFFDHAGKFRKTAQKLVRDIVDELHKPYPGKDKERKYMPLQQIPDELAVFVDDEDLIPGGGSYTCKSLVYSIDNIFIKLVHQGEQLTDNTPLMVNPMTGLANRTSGGNTSGIGDNTYLQAQSQNQNADPFQNLKWKLYGREFLSMDVMFDTLYLLSKPDSSHKLRVPLSAQVDYKGFRALAVACIPIQPQLGLSIGFYTDNKYVPHDPKLKQELQYVGDVLNLKENRITQKGSSQFESVPVSSFIKVFNQLLPESKGKTQESNIPKQKFQEYHFSELKYLEEPFYVLKTSEIFPYDSDLNELHPRKDKYLRPEFICSYERPLKADARKEIGQKNKDAKDQNKNKDMIKSKDDENDQVDLNEASRYLRSTIIPNLVNLLDSLIIMPIDSESLENTFHSQGVNMRYLGLVTSLSIVPHVRDICITEMIARSCKTILNKQMVAMINDHHKRWNDCRDKMELLQKQKKNKNQLSQQSILNPNKRINQFNQQNQEFDQKEQELKQEEEELSQNMDDEIKKAIVDYINLVFGAGEETDEFWNSVLLPYASQYFNFPFEELQKANRYLNALFFAFISQMGIKIGKNIPSKKDQEPIRGNERLGKEDKYGSQMQKDDDYFKEFGKSTTPFGLPEKTYHRIEIVGRSKTYGLRNLTYKLLADKYSEYKAEGKVENALKCCKMKRLMKRLLEDREDVSTIADICEVALDHEKYKIAKEQAIEGLKHVQPLHAEAIKFQCILMRAFYGLDFNQEADQYFSKALTTLDHHWGPFHPLHATIYGIMAYLLIKKNKYEEAKYLYQSSQLCYLRILGPNHIQTAEVHMDFGRLYLKMKNKDESLQHFELAYLIYDNYFGQNGIQTANAAMQIATILEEQGKLNDAYQYAKISSDTYRFLHGEESERTIFAKFLLLSISYSLKKTTETLDECKHLYSYLLKRDKAIENMMEDNSRNDIQNNNIFEEKINKIKQLCVAATILHMTRSLLPEHRQTIKAYCDKLLFRAHQLDEDDSLPKLADLQHSINQHKIMSLSNLKFDQFGEEFLLQSYENSKEPFNGGSIVEYYKKSLDGAISQYQQEQKQAAGGTQSAKTNALGGVANRFKDLREQNGLTDNWPGNTDDNKVFFTKIIKAFEHVNFYNVLVL